MEDGRDKAAGGRSHEWRSSGIIIGGKRWSEKRGEWSFGRHNAAGLGACSLRQSWQNNSVTGDRCPSTHSSSLPQKAVVGPNTARYCQFGRLNKIGEKKLTRPIKFLSRAILSVLSLLFVFNYPLSIAIST